MGLDILPSRLYNSIMSNRENAPAQAAARRYRNLAWLLFTGDAVPTYWQSKDLSRVRLYFEGSVQTGGIGRPGRRSTKWFVEFGTDGQPTTARGRAWVERVNEAAREKCAAREANIERQLASIQGVADRLADHPNTPHLLAGFAAAAEAARAYAVDWIDPIIHTYLNGGGLDLAALRDPRGDECGYFGERLKLDAFLPAD
jgi:hypothetical protein